MNKYRVIRGTASPRTGRMFATGTNYTARTAREAVKLDEEATRKAFGDPGPMGVFAGTKPHPIIAVYEMVAVDDSDWR